MRSWLALILLAGCAGKGINAPAPPRELGEQTESLPPTRGVIVAPISVHLPSAMAALNRIIPDKLGTMDRVRQLSMGRGRKASLAFEVNRDPFELLKFSGDTVHLAAVLHYRGRAWIDSPLGDITGACGINTVPPRARVVLQVVPYLTEDWHLGMHSRIAQLAALSDSARDRCQVTFLGLNVTGKVMEAAREALEKAFPRIQERIASVDVKTPLEDIWFDLQKPIRLADSVWLLLKPDSISVGPLHTASRPVHVELGVSAAPRIVTGPRPPIDSSPLPPLRRSQMERGFSLPVEGRLDYDVIGNELTRKLQGKNVRVGGGEFRLRRLTVYGIPGGRLTVGVHFEGTTRGVIWLVGTPEYDPASGMIRVPDLDFDASSAGLLIAGFAWIKGNEIRDFLRQQAQVSAGALLSELTEMAVKQMNRPVTRGVRLFATIGAAEPQGILVRSRDILLRARAMGSARLEIGAEVFQKPREAASGGGQSALGKSPPD